MRPSPLPAPPATPTGEAVHDAPRVPLRESLDQATRVERQRALSALLMRPLLTAQGDSAEDFARVRRHSAWLREWLLRHPGWSLQIESEYARLRKTPADPSDATRPARGPGGAPLTRRRYVLLSLALAALWRADRQIILGKLADDLRLLWASEPRLGEVGLALDLALREDRRDLAEVVKLLIEWRALRRIQGDESDYVSGQGDVLYTISRPVLAALLSARRSPSSIDAAGLPERLRALCEEPTPDTAEGKNRRLRLSLLRRLLDDPVVYFHELSDDERQYLSGQRGSLLQTIHEATGLHGEVRREGIAMTDEDGDLTDLGIPEEGTEGHVTLLLAEHLAEHLRRDPAALVSRAALHRHTAGLIAGHREHWRKDAGLPGAEVWLTDQALERLAALRLCRLSSDGILPLPAVARYAISSAPARGRRRRSS